MIMPRLKKFEDSIRYDYAVCELEECVNEATMLSMTETRYVDFCEQHHREHILGAK
jgi:hypothetical protein